MISFRRAAIAAVTFFAVGALAAPASAATQNATAGGNAVVASSGAGVVPAFSSCPVSAFGYAGQKICGTTEYDHPGIDGRVAEVFVIGTNWQIWHAWQGSNGWHSLGGVAQHSSTNGVFLWSLSPFAIKTHGNDSSGTWYCDNWGVPSWGGWHPCPTS